MRLLALLLLFLVSCSIPCLAQEQEAVGQASPPVNPPGISSGLDNKHVRTTRLSIAPHQALTLPKLEHENLLISLRAGSLFRRPNFGQPESLQLAPGNSLWSRGSH